MLLATLVLSRRPLRPPRRRLSSSAQYCLRRWQLGTRLSSSVFVLPSGPVRQDFVALRSQSVWTTPAADATILLLAVINGGDKQLISGRCAVRSPYARTKHQQLTAATPHPAQAHRQQHQHQLATAASTATAAATTTSNNNIVTITVTGMVIDHAVVAMILGALVVVVVVVIIVAALTLRLMVAIAILMLSCRIGCGR